MDGMSDSASGARLAHGELPPIPDGSGILPVAENRISHGPHPELLDALPEGFTPHFTGPERDAPVVNDALEQTYRRVLARALALAGAALLLAAVVAASLVHDPAVQVGFAGAQLVFQVVFFLQLMFVSFCTRYVEKLPIIPAAVLLFCYAIFCSLEFSALFSARALLVGFLCAGLMYAVTAAWGFSQGTDLARPVTGVLMIVAGGVILVAVNLLLGTPSYCWTVSSLAVVIFAGLEVYYAQQIRDFYQDFDDDNAEGWKASVLGALLLLVNCVNCYLLAASFVARKASDDDEAGPTNHLPN
jgi:FtsH-binding integral membrane protein